MFRGCGHCSRLLWEYSCSICGTLWELPRDGLPLPPGPPHGSGTLGAPNLAGCHGCPAGCGGPGWGGQGAVLILAGTCSAAGSIFISEAPSVCFSETFLFQNLRFVEKFQKLGIISN